MTVHRRLSDKIDEAHRIACEENRQDVAEVLLRALEKELEALGTFSGEERRSVEMLEEASVRHADRFPDSHL